MRRSTPSGSSRNYRGDKLIRVAKPHKLLDPKAGTAHRREAAHPHPQDASAASRPTSRAPRSAPGGSPIPGLYAAGEASGFGGGGMHGYRALEGTFLGGCIFSGRAAGRGAAASV